MSQPRHYLTGDLVLKESWSPEDNALKVIPAANTEFAVELNHLDNDSVFAMRKTSVITAGIDVEADDFSECALFGTGTVSVSADGVQFFVLTNIPIVPVKMCAKVVRLTSEDPNCKLVLKA